MERARALETHRLKLKLGSAMYELYDPGQTVLNAPQPHFTICNIHVKHVPTK